MKRFISLVVIVLLATTATADVLINLVRPFNSGTGVDEDAPGVVQLYNDGLLPVNLSGWHIKTDNWSYPILFWTLPADCYLYVVFGDGTSDPDFTDNVGTLYTGGTYEFSRGGDEAGLYLGYPDPSTIVDFVGWGVGGSSFGEAYDDATAAGIWTVDDFVDLTAFGIFASISRIPSGYDTDQPSDWQEVGREGCDHFSPHNSIQLEPIDGILSDAITDLRWKPINGATDYTVEVDDDQNFGSINYSQTTTGTSTPFTLGNGEWYWRVRPNLPTVHPAAVWRLSKGIPDIDQTTWSSVPQRYQHKDSKLLCIWDLKNETRPGCTEDAGSAGPWDNEHSQTAGHIPGCPHCGNYCTRASIQMVNARYGGSLKQDEISYHGWQSKHAGQPEGDLGHGKGLWPQANSTYSWAMNNVAIDSISIGSGEFPWDDLVALIDQNRPVLAVKHNGSGGLHCVVITGYSTTLGRQRIHVTDPWPNSTGWFENSRVSWKCYYPLQSTPTGRAMDSNVSADADGDGVKNFDEGQQSSQQVPRTFCSLHNKKDTEGDEVNDKQEIRSYTFHDTDHGGHNNDALDFADTDHDGLRQECDCDGDNDSDFDGGEDINGDGKNPIDGLETCEYQGEHLININVFALWGWWLCTEDVYAYGRTYHNYSTYPAELLVGCPGHNDGDPLHNNLALFAAEDGIIHPQYIGSYGPGEYQLTVDVLKDALYSAPDNTDPKVCFTIPPHILIVPPPPYPTPIPPPPVPTPVPTGDYGGALTTLGKQYVVYDYPWGGPGPSLEELLEYPVIIWATGALVGTMSGTDAQNLMEYIDLGGKVFFTGQDIALDAVTSGDIDKVTLLNNYMGAFYVGENPGCVTVSSIAGGFLDGYTNLSIDRYNGVYWDYQSPDDVAPAIPNLQLMSYDFSPDCFPEGGMACMATEGPNGMGRSVYMSFPWESIDDEIIRIEILERILQWLYGEPMDTPPITDMTVYRMEEGITLNWTPIEGAISYEIYASEDSEFEPTEENKLTVIESPPFVDPYGFDYEKRFYNIVAVGSLYGEELYDWMTQQSDLETIRARLEDEGIHYREFKATY